MAIMDNSRLLSVGMGRFVEGGGLGGLPDLNQKYDRNKHYDRNFLESNQGLPDFEPILGLYNTAMQIGRDIDAISGAPEAALLLQRAQALEGQIIATLDRTRGLLPNINRGYKNNEGKAYVRGMNDLQNSLNAYVNDIGALVNQTKANINARIARDDAQRVADANAAVEATRAAKERQIQAQNEAQAAQQSAQAQAQINAANAAKAATEAVTAQSQGIIIKTKADADAALAIAPKFAGIPVPTLIKYGGIAAVAYFIMGRMHGGQAPR